MYPKLFAWPPARDVGHALERLGVAVLVAARCSRSSPGMLNIARWYTPMFFFTAAHYWTAWLASARCSSTSRSSCRSSGARSAGRRTRRPANGPELSRRGLLCRVGAAAAVVTVATVGQTSPAGSARRCSRRVARSGPQGLPVNQSARRPASRGAAPTRVPAELAGPAAARR